MNKKGSVGEQVNWIYVLIAGSIILVFFVTMAIREKQAMDLASAEDALRRMDTITQQQPGSSNLIEMPGLELNKNCDGGKIELSVGKALPITAVDPLFGSSLIKSNKLITMATEWDVPFRVADFVFLTSDDTYYIVRYDTANPQSEKLADRIMAELPDDVNKKKSPDNNYGDIGVRRLVVVFSGDPLPQGETLPDWTHRLKPESITAVKISDSFDKGSLFFYKALGDFTLETELDTNGAGAIEFAGKSMALAAIYSDNRAAFECGMKKAYQRLNMVSEVYSLKIGYLKSATTTNPNCAQADYNSMLNLIQPLKTGGTDAEITAAINSNYKAIDTQNTKILLASCPTVY